MELIIAAIISIAMIVSWLFLPATAVAETMEREEVAPLTTVQTQA